MTNRIFFISAFAAIYLTVSTFGSAATQDKNFEPSFLQVSHLSCEEVWVRVDKKDNLFFEVVEMLAYHILTSRKINFPDSNNVARAFGDALVKGCLEDPDELLYSVVSRSLRDTLPVK